MSADWKVKYLDIRAKLKEATDVAYRLGMEAGLKQGAQQAQMQAMQQQQQMQQQMMQGGQPGQPGMEGDPSQGQMPPGAEGGDPGMEQGAPPPEAMGDAGGGSELDSHISELEGLVAKGEKPTVLDIRKAVQALAGIRKNQKNIWQKKMDKVIPAQKSVVDSILKKWEDEAKKPSEGIEALIKQHGLKIGE